MAQKSEVCSEKMSSIIYLRTLLGLICCIYCNDITYKSALSVQICNAPQKWYTQTMEYGASNSTFKGLILREVH